MPAAALVLAGDALGAFGLTQRLFLVLASLFTLVAGLRFAGAVRPVPAQHEVLTDGDEVGD